MREAQKQWLVSKIGNTGIQKKSTIITIAEVNCKYNYLLIKEWGEEWSSGFIFRIVFI